MGLNVSCGLHSIIQALCVLKIAASKIITGILVVSSIAGVEHINVALQSFLRSLDVALGIRSQRCGTLFHIIELELRASERTRPPQKFVLRARILLDCESDHRQRGLIQVRNIHNDARPIM